MSDHSIACTKQRISGGHECNIIADFCQNRKIVDLIEIDVGFVRPINNDSDFITDVPLIQECDRSQLRYVRFDVDPRRDMMYGYSDVLDGGYLDVVIGGMNVCRYEFGILMNLSPFRKIGNSIFMHIPSEWSLDIALHSLRNTTVHFHLVVKKAILFTDVKLSVINSYIGKEWCYRLSTIIHGQFFQSFSNVCCVPIEGNESDERVFNFRMCQREFVKGYFLEGDISHIKRFQISFDGHVRIDYDQTLLQFNCHRISGTLHYLSYTGLNDYADSSSASFISGASHSALDVLLSVSVFGYKLSCRRKLKIYTVSCNLIKYNQNTVFFVFPCTSSMDYTSAPLENDNVGEEIVSRNVFKNFPGYDAADPGGASVYISGFPKYGT